MFTIFIGLCIVFIIVYLYIDIKEKNDYENTERGGDLGFTDFGCKEDFSQRIEDDPWAIFREQRTSCNIKSIGKLREKEINIINYITKMIEKQTMKRNNSYSYFKRLETIEVDWKYIEEYFHNKGFKVKSDNKALYLTWQKN